MKLRIAAAALLLCAVVPAYAQRTPLYQSGVPSPRDLLISTTNGIAERAPGLNGDVNGRGVNPFSITDNNGPAVCSASAVTSGTHSRFCLGHNAAGEATLSLMNSGTTAGAKLVIDGVEYPMLGTVNGTPFVASNSALAAVSASFSAVMMRADYTPGRNAGALAFRTQTGTCAAAGLVNDGGSCVDGPDGNSWLSQPGPEGITFEQFGAVGSGLVDDRPQIDAAIVAAGIRKFPIRIGKNARYGIGATPITCNTPIRMIGNTGLRTLAPTAMPGFVPLQTNTTVLQILNGCSGSVFEGLALDMSAPGTQTSSANPAIRLGASDGSNVPARITLERVVVYKPCVALDIEGNTIYVDQFAAREVMGSGCGGIRIGRFGTGGVTLEPVITRSQITSDPTKLNPADFGMLLADAGGGYFAFNDIIHFTQGTVIFPGENQRVVNNFFTNTTLGDNILDEVLSIDTAHATAEVKRNSFDNVWMAAFDVNPGTALVTIANTAGATGFSGFNFATPRAYLANRSAFDVLAGSHFSLQGGKLCAYAQHSLQAGVTIGSGVTHFKIQGNTILPDCDALTGGGDASSVNINSAANDGVVTGNIVNVANANPITFTPASDSRIIIKDNPGSEFEFDGGMSVVCTGLDTGSCELTAGSSPGSFRVVLSPTGAPGTTGDITITAAFGAARSAWTCTAGLQAGSAAWLTTAFIRIPAGTATNPVVRWDTGGAALTAGSTYNVVGSCRKI